MTRNTRASTPPVDEAQLFLSLVAAGNQAAAKVMLKKNPKLVLAKDTCIDPAGRRFPEITAFQYALWAMDHRMCAMLLKYFKRVSPEAAYQQCLEQEALTAGYGHGACYDFNELLAPMSECIKRRDYLSKIKDKSCTDAAWDERAQKCLELDKIWVEQVGGAQRNLPAHVAQKYCHPEFRASSKRQLGPIGGMYLIGDSWWTAAHCAITKDINHAKKFAKPLGEGFAVLKCVAKKKWGEAIAWRPTACVSVGGIVKGLTALESNHTELVRYSESLLEWREQLKSGLAPEAEAASAAAEAPSVPAPKPSEPEKKLPAADPVQPNRRRPLTRVSVSASCLYLLMRPPAERQALTKHASTGALRLSI
ncbi:MAG: hypothetical protein K0U29_00090 [Gammaproteobacteria bacterium]|nr:hypothetical protein [Gammaproteobacteria bacterium]